MVVVGVGGPRQASRSSQSQPRWTHTFVFSVDNKMLMVEILSSFMPELKIQGINSENKSCKELNTGCFETRSKQHHTWFQFCTNYTSFQEQTCSTAQGKMTTGLAGCLVLAQPHLMLSYMKQKQLGPIWESIL